jgi:hypothetical protein
LVLEKDGRFLTKSLYMHVAFGGGGVDQQKDERSVGN